MGLASPEVPGSDYGDVEYLEILPNPFRYQAIIRYKLRNPEKVSLQVLDVSGRITKKVVPQKDHDSGEFQVTWDLSTNEGTLARNGLYLIVIQTAEDIKVQKAVLLR